MGFILIDSFQPDNAFLLNFWNWHPIVKVIKSLDVLPLARADGLHESCAGNGLSREEARAVAAAIRSKVLLALSSEERILLDGARTTEPDDFVFHRVDLDKNY